MVWALGDSTYWGSSCRASFHGDGELEPSCGMKAQLENVEVIATSRRTWCRPDVGQWKQGCGADRMELQWIELTDFQLLISLSLAPGVQKSLISAGWQDKLKVIIRMHTIFSFVLYQNNLFLFQVIHLHIAIHILNLLKIIRKCLHQSGRRLCRKIPPLS